MYFAYGSNMDAVQMAERCAGAVLKDVGVLPHHRFLINSRGYATVIPNPKAEVYGLLWSVTPADIKSLDRYEGVKAGVYSRSVVEVRVGAATQSAWIYIDPDSTPGSPKASYLERIIAAARGAGFPESYVAALRGPGWAGA